MIKSNKNYAKKEIFRSIKNNKNQLIILALMNFLTSFMYFFVQCSIDGNRKILRLDQTEFKIALDSNSVLASSFLYALLSVTAFILYMYYSSFYKTHKKEIGCLKAIGIQNISINKICIFFTCELIFLSAVAGMIAGWCASGILNNAYIDSYSLTVVKRGINFSSFSYGVLLDTAVMILMTYLAGRKNLKQETAFLISNSESKKDYPIIDKLSNHITKFLPEKIRFSVRIALRKPITIILTMIAVMTAMTLVIMSISLNLSSKKVYDIQTEGRTYQWDTKYSGYLNENNNKRNNNDENNNNGNKINTKEEIRYLEEEVKLIVPSYKKASITQKIVGLENLNNLFQLVNKEGKNIDLPLGNQIIISEELEEVYGVKPGDKIKIIYNGKNYPCLVADIARNAEQKRIYISKDTLTKWIGNDANIYNGILSMRQPAERGKSVSMKERLEELDRAAVSNRTSAVLNQILGGVLGCLLIYLVILLNFNDSMKEILILHLLGYRTKQINTMLISIYRPIIGFSFFIMIYPSIYICKSIQRNLSIQTNDYMPFQTNISVLIFTFILINIIYNVVKYAFGKKIRKIIIQEDIQKQLF